VWVDGLWGWGWGGGVGGGGGGGGASFPPPPPPTNFLHAALVVCVCGASIYTVGASYTVQTFVGCLSVTQVAVGMDSTTSILQTSDLFPALFFSTKLDKISYNEHSGCNRLTVMAHSVRMEQTWHSQGNTPCMGLYMLAPRV